MIDKEKAFEFELPTERWNKPPHFTLYWNGQFRGKEDYLVEDGKIYVNLDLKVDKDDLKLNWISKERMSYFGRIQLLGDPPSIEMIGFPYDIKNEEEEEI